MTATDTHLHIDGVSKSFGTVKALSEIDMKIDRGSFVCLLGPSGCGKTTLLRIIAGFEKASAGKLLLDGADISQVLPHKREFGMVFQSLALFPHMSVAKNIAYGLKLRGESKKQQSDRVEELLNVIELPHIADRQVSELSGGQRQRVAIARALAVRPKLFLLDEPLSALDAKLRDSMQVELRQLQRKFGVTTVLVTHDQTEAMMLADRLVVMKDGIVRQDGVPGEVYRQPKDTFVADFLGAANIVKGTATASGNLRLLGREFKIPTQNTPGETLDVAIRGEDISIETQSISASSPKGTVSFVRETGASQEWIISSQGEQLRVRTANNGQTVASVGDEVGLKIDVDRLTVFNA